MHHQYFTEREQLAIVGKLYSMRKAGEVGPFWVEHQGQVLYMDVGRPFEEMGRRISWNEAERIVKGEPWRLVLKVA